MAKVHEITVWARGVVQDKEARDVARLLGDSAYKEGKYMQAFDNYVDLPDRVGVPVRKYTRISNEEIEEKFIYENEHPEVVVILDAALVKGMNILRGMEKGGVLVVNTEKSPEDILKFVPNKELLSAVATIDAWGIAPQAVVDFSGTEGAMGGAAFGAGIGAVLAGAAAKVSGLVKIDTILSVAANAAAAKRGYDEVKIKKL